MKRLSFCALAAVVLTLTFTTPAQAFDPCYDWVCYKSTKQCVFDAGCSGDNGQDARDFEWDFGDGTTLDAGNQPLAGHIYSSGATASVTLDVGYLFIGYYDITCTVQFAPVVGGDPSTQWSGTCQ